MSRPDHDEVLSAEELELWRAVRAARSDFSGDRSAAIAEVARRRGLDRVELNEQIAEMKARLVAAGAVAKERFFVVRSPLTGRCVATSAPEGSRRCEAIVADGPVGEFESLRFAYNAACALNLIAELDEADRATFADHFDAVLDAASSADQRVHEVVELPSGRTASVLGHATASGCYLLGAPGRPWTGRLNHARFIAAAVRAGSLPDRQLTAPAC